MLCMGLARAPITGAERSLRQGSEPVMDESVRAGDAKREP